MLVLTRKLNEQIVIGQLGITVKIVEVKGGRVRFGIEAPANVRIERREILAALEAIGAESNPA